MSPYERLRAWQLTHELALSVYRVTESFPVHEKYGLTSQLRRAALSAAVNIVEGSTKRGKREFRRFLDISLGSLAEVGYLLRFARDLQMLTEAGWRVIEQHRNHAAIVTWKLYSSVRDASL